MSLFWGCAFSSFAGPATLPSGAVAWLKAENNANDSSGNTNNGVVDGLVTYAAGEVYPSDGARLDSQVQNG